MSSYRLQEIIKPLEDLLIKNGFQREGEPMVEGFIRMASFIKDDGTRVDYALEVKKDGWIDYDSNTDIYFDVKLYKNGETIPLNELTEWETNMSTPVSIKGAVEEDIAPNLKQYL